MEKIVISSREVAETATPAEQPTCPEPKLAPPISLWARVALSPLVLVLPALCLVAIVIRVAMRNLPPRNRYAWLGFLQSLLIVSGFLTSVAFVLAMSFAPLPSIVAEGLGDFDESTQFAALPSASTMTAKEVSEKLKPLVTVIAPAWRTWFTHREIPSASFGAGVLLQAGSEGYLIATARHVVEESLSGESEGRALVATSSGIWAGAEVVGRHKTLDLALLWVKRREGSGSFVLPVASVPEVSQGENIFIIGHPQGLRFTLSTGIVSRIEKDTIQITAPVSPGNSGGPVFDDRGHLAGIVTSMIDKGSNPNAENLNFAVRADALLDGSEWLFSETGRTRFDAFANAQKHP